jgi:hypothetical protein
MTHSGSISRFVVQSLIVEHTVMRFNWSVIGEADLAVMVGRLCSGQRGGRGCTALSRHGVVSVRLVDFGVWECLEM